MKFLGYIYVFCICFIIISCGSPIKNIHTKEEPVVIKNDSLEYEIIIIDQGFTTYLHTVAKPVGYYSQNYLENKNRIYVTIWNYRASNPMSFNANIYGNKIDYSSNVDYGYNVNYKLYNYFEFAQRKYKIRLH